ncbi:MULTISPECIES: PEP-CTERM sorting domain-containing protein [unclassified Roseateles]|uniref:PEP-CTERM sorting domain-containing protein n=1 Tax=unclassified Roseateles TaxID=2626991 RepID=UPI00071475B7|nr:MULTISPECIES: PEP-CTERM sorting domain-containing protein [unclassified Roseateles]KQW45508.1 hypothetical protein ASC81_11400 [Pelomonas sp. Root405]KRA72352.1 hypothetical protein ASD88_11400 [Pelomonas sp. Root662]
MNKFAISAAALALAALGAWTPSASAALIYGTSAIGASPRTSDYGTVSGGGFRTFDNFTSASGASVERVSWRGLWFGNTTPAPAPAPLVDTWEIAFHASGGGAPGAVLWSQNIAPASVGATFAGTGVLNAGGSYNVSLYDYVLDLPAVFNLAAGTEYWISVTAIADDFNPAFAILGATGGDDASYQQTLGAGMAVVSGQSVARDRAFRIEGTFTVPEPGTLALGGIALAALAGLRGRRTSPR